MNHLLLIGSSTVTEGMSTALTTLQSDVLGVIGTVAPFGIGIMGAFLTWRYGLRFFKSISK